MRTRGRAAGAQAHLDPLVAAVVEGDVLERSGVEVGVEVRVEHVQDVAVELRRHAGRVVVGGLEPGAVLDEVGADQQAVVRAEQPATCAACAGALRGEVADRAAEERDRRAAARPARDPVEVALEVADDAVDREARDTRPRARRRVRTPTRRRRPGRSAQLPPPPSGRAARASCARSRSPSSTSSRGAGRARRCSAARLVENRLLRARRVVLGQLGDALEQLPAARVVEVLRRQRLRAREPVAHVLGEARERRRRAGARRSSPAPPRRRRHRSTSFAHRRPAKSCRRCG